MPPKPGCDHRQFISSRRKIGDDVITGVVRGRGVGLIRIQITKRDGSFDYGGAVCVLHGPVELSETGGGLRIRLVCATQENRNCDGRKQPRTSFHNLPPSMSLSCGPRKNFSRSKKL